ncbi:hypothetical protein ABIE45_003455 [Methylobacterium sp. OAE515]
MSHKWACRFYRDEGLSLRLKRMRRHVSAPNYERQPVVLRPNERWSKEFISDALFAPTARPERRGCIHARGSGD